MSQVKFNLHRRENYIDLDLYQSGREECDPAQIFGPAARNHYLFHFITQGKETLMAQRSDGSTLNCQLQSGQGFLLFPGQIAAYFADEKDPWTYCWLEFDGLRVKEALDQTDLNRDNPVYRTHTPSLREKKAEEMELIILNSDGRSSLFVIGHLYLFFDDLIQSSRRSSSQPAGRLSDFYVKEAVSCIEQNYQNKITIEDIAQSLGIDRSCFGKLFRRGMGKSPQQFLIHYRMVKAAELLRTADLAIGEIGERVGYDSQLHFSKAFKTVYGLSPRDWRKAEKADN
ncbi:MAG: AraC family transcriptional regulator [Erysipelotrichaceae bacterium]|nr:AraC family transcriptional regulator [Erysipelotrichaceae bacterium]